ncbi:uncharacterized protein HKW66_Vig0246140 [Vigna angularis]|uniref:Uncharacterized protein n=1 Tax=Phaseolus angularis TaxID=3914 RepID=A0A8T0KB36_PHAAN|nr:uncharacterized protein HKW66_Vig0246140 [Vigna angularis]
MKFVWSFGRAIADIVLVGFFEKRHLKSINIINNLFCNITYSRISTITASENYNHKIKILGGLTEARLSIVAVLSMMLLFGMEPCYLAVSASTSVIVYKSSDHYYLRNFNKSFLEVSYGFASNDVSDVMETERINIEKTVLDSNSRPAGTEFRSGTVTNAVKHDDEVDGESDEGSFSLTTLNFDNYVNQTLLGRKQLKL